MKIEDRYKGIIDWFSRNMPVAESELHYKSPFQLLIATILAAQCTDKRVNMTTPALFDKYPTPKLLAEAHQEEVFDYIKSISYPNSKAKYLVGTAQMLVSDFGSEVPSDVDQLQKLPGVGRKTANVVASVAFNKYVMPVDTHVFRVSARIGLTKGAKTPLQTENQLVKHLPAELLPIAHHWLILHGRYICTARKPHCDQCGVTKLCKYWEKEGAHKILS